MSGFGIEDGADDRQSLLPELMNGHGGNNADFIDMRVMRMCVLDNYDGSYNGANTDRSLKQCYMPPTLCDNLPQTHLF